MKTAAIILLIMAGVIGSPAVVELQRAEVVFLNSEEKGKRANLFLNPEIDERKVGKINELDLRMKWTIVSGSFYESVDRVRTRLRFNNEKWIDLHAAKNAQGSFDFNIVRLREFDDGPKDTSKISDDALNLGDAAKAAELSDLRIEDWNHDRLLIKFTPRDDSPAKYFRFEL